MDIKIIQTEMCGCGRQVISVTGCCGICIREGAQAFWDLADGKITYPGFIRRLRRGTRSQGSMLRCPGRKEGNERLPEFRGDR